MKTRCSPAVGSVIAKKRIDEFGKENGAKTCVAFRGFVAALPCFIISAAGERRKLGEMFAMESLVSGLGVRGGQRYHPRPLPVLRTSL